MSAKILLIILLLFIKHCTISCIKGLDRIRADYCELYCGGSCNNKKCSIDNRILATEDYKMELSISKLLFTWTNRDFQQWNIYKIANESDCSILKITVAGIPRADDTRLRPAVQYLRLLGIQEIVEFEMYAPSLTITEREIHIDSGPEMLDFKYLSDSTVNSVVIDAYIRESMNNTKQIKIYAYTSEKPTLTIETHMFEGKNQLQMLVFSGLNVKGLTTEAFDHLTSLVRLVFDNVVLKNFEFFGLVKISH